MSPSFVTTTEIVHIYEELQGWRVSADTQQWQGVCAGCPRVERNTQRKHLRIIWYVQLTAVRIRVLSNTYMYSNSYHVFFLRFPWCSAPRLTQRLTSSKTTLKECICEETKLTKQSKHTNNKLCMVFLRRYVMDCWAGTLWHERYWAVKRALEVLKCFAQICHLTSCTRNLKPYLCFLSTLSGLGTSQTGDNWKLAVYSSDDYYSIRPLFFFFLFPHRIWLFSLFFSLPVLLFKS